MTALVISEHDNSELKGATLNTISAALQLDEEIHVLVAGSNCNTVAESAAKANGVSKVLYVDSPEYENFLAENISLLIKNLSGDYSSILAPATTNGKNYMPRVAAFLDVAQISDISSVLLNGFKPVFVDINLNNLSMKAPIGMGIYAFISGYEMGILGQEALGKRAGAYWFIIGLTDRIGKQYEVGGEYIATNRKIVLATSVEPNLQCPLTSDNIYNSAGLYSLYYITGVDTTDDLLNNWSQEYLLYQFQY
mgnify:CR=1 FL=1